MGSSNSWSSISAPSRRRIDLTPTGVTFSRDATGIPPPSTVDRTDEVALVNDIYCLKNPRFMIDFIGLIVCGAIYLIVLGVMNIKRAESE